MELINICLYSLSAYILYTLFTLFHIYEKSHRKIEILRFKEILRILICDNYVL